MVKAAFTLNKTIRDQHRVSCIHTGQGFRKPRASNVSGSMADDFAMQVFCINKQLKPASTFSPII